MNRTATIAARITELEYRFRTCQITADEWIELQRLRKAIA
jgi:hypothetical protein